MLRERKGAHKHQHSHIKACLTKIKSLTHTISTSSFNGDFPLLSARFCLSHTRRAGCITLLAFFQSCAHTRPDTFYTTLPRRSQTTDTLRKHSEDSRRRLCSLLLHYNNKSDFTLVPYSVTAFSSLRLPVVFPFEADLISHIRTSIFLKRAEYDCFDPFHMRKLRPEQPATLKREVISFPDFLQIFFWLTWERCISFT